MLSNLGWVAGVQGDFPASRAYLEQALDIAREVGNPYQEAYTLINLSAVLSIQGEANVALQYARLANELCRKIGERSGEAWALLNIGHACLLAEELDQAQFAYEQCLSIRDELRQPTLSAEALAGLAQIALYKADLLALTHLTESICSIMEIDGNFTGAEEPLRIYYTCHQALELMKDPRARAVLQIAKRLLEAQVSKFKDENERRRYVENVPWRRAIHQSARSLTD
jgi:tetratricopeptide (TPR) repeat protein